ncbi:hypothetical protein [Mumia sp. Pv 4-285]|uniref:hypothetical protein n=1 Tax=Mumia qirimensis TaxID=3234852 RepID=UPI00351D5275
MSTSANDRHGVLVPEPWVGLVDDAATFPPGDSALPDAVAAHLRRRHEWYADLVGTFVVKHGDVPAVASAPLALSVLVSGDPGTSAGVVRGLVTADATIAGLEVAPTGADDLVEHVHRTVAAITAARRDGDLDDVPVYVELPVREPTSTWLDAVDALAVSGMHLKLRTGGLAAAAFPSSPPLAASIAAAVEREVPFKCTAGLHHAVRHRSTEGFEHHGFVNVLVATARAIDGAAVEEIAAALDVRDGAALVEEARTADLAAARRRFTSFGSCSVVEPVDDLLALGLLETP